MAIRVSIQGASTADALVRRLERVPAEAERAIRAVVRATALKVEASAKEAIQRGPKSGRLYRTTNKRKMHRASAPGEAPATDTGALVSRIHSRVFGGGLEAAVSSNVSYAAYLEFGADRMAPRPYLAPALQEHAEAFERDLGLAVAGVLDLP